MNKLYTAKFHQTLKETGGYKTNSDKKRHPFPSWLATIFFNLSMARIFVMGYIYARRPNFMDKYWSEFGLMVYRLIERLGGTIEVKGFDKLNNHGKPVVFVCNHACPPCAVILSTKIILLNISTFQFFYIISSPN